MASTKDDAHPFQYWVATIGPPKIHWSWGSNSKLLQGIINAWFSIMRTYYSRLRALPQESSRKLELQWNPHSLHYCQQLMQYTSNGSKLRSNFGPWATSVGGQAPPAHVWDSTSKSWLHLEQLLELTGTPSAPNSPQSSNQASNCEDVWCVNSSRISLKAILPSISTRGSEFLQELGLTTTQQCQTWDLLWERGKSKKISRFLWRVLTKNLTLMQCGGKGARCECCNQDVVETIRHCLYDCPKAQEVWARICRLRRHLGILHDLSWEELLLGSPQVLSIVQSLRQVSHPGSTPQFRRRIRESLSGAASIYLWELTRSFTLWHIWSALCSSCICHQHDVPVDVIIFRVWNELLLSARSLQEDMKESLLMQQYERMHHLDQLFWTCYDYKETLFRKGPNGNTLLWYSSPPIWLLSE